MKMPKIKVFWVLLNAYSLQHLRQKTIYHEGHEEIKEKQGVISF